jgi:hypothetical protein
VAEPTATNTPQPPAPKAAENGEGAAGE